MSAYWKVRGTRWDSGWPGMKDSVFASLMLSAHIHSDLMDSVYLMSTF